MNNFEFSVPCLFGLEGLAGDELRRLDIQNVRVENGRVLFSGDERALAKANVCLRTGERVLLTLADFKATTFEQLFQGVYNCNLEDFIPKDGQFPVKGHCLSSQLMSVPDCQAIIKKAASKRLGEKNGVNFLYRDFRPYFKDGQNFAREHGFYMQKYCGCVFSEEERYIKPKKLIP